MALAWGHWAAPQIPLVKIIQKSTLHQENHTSGSPVFSGPQCSFLSGMSFRHLFPPFFFFFSCFFYYYFFSCFPFSPFFLFVFPLFSSIFLFFLSFSTFFSFFLFYIFLFLFLLSGAQNLLLGLNCFTISFNMSVTKIIF